MGMISTVSKLIDRAVIVPGYTNPVAYDNEHSDSFGYWLCIACKIGFFGGGEDYHKAGCDFKKRRKHLYDYNDKCLIYVLGPEESGFFSPFKGSNIQTIKDIAKDRLYPKGDQQGTTL